MNIAFNKLKKFFNTLSGDTKIYTHAWEGGNEDHDACNILIKCILYKSKRKLKCFQFPLYNANSKIFYYQVQKTLKENGKIRKIKANFYNRMKYIKYLFFYKSQLRVWVGLYPFLITNLIFKQSIQIQYLNKNIKFKRPHKGLLLYEKFKRCNYKEFKQTMNLFLNKYIYN